MSKEYLDGKTYARMLMGGAQNLNANKKVVNELNVFPVPDGDTGDNMYMTINAGTEIKDENMSISEVADKAAKNMLLGARGNSGVILSRIFAGIAKGLRGSDEASIEDIKKATACGVSESYMAVTNPVEGTILSVFKDGVEAANSLNSATLNEYLDTFIDAIEKSLDKTPDQLQVLKDAGVVDSGGAGLVYIAKGMKEAINGNLNIKESENCQINKKIDTSSFNEDSILEYGYCTEFLLQLQNCKVDVDNFDENQLLEYLKNNGESVVAFKEGSIIKVHVHTKNPGEILKHFQEYGEFLTVKIENMMIQHHEANISNNYSPKKRKKKNGIVTVAMGDGIQKLFKEIGADEVVSGGQSMNPSTQDLIDAFKKVNAENIFLLPNNKNIFMAATQAKQLYKDANVYILETKDIGEGYVALSNLDMSRTNPDKVISEAMNSIKNIETAMVSIASRDVKEENIIKDNYIGFVDEKIKSCDKDRLNATKKLLTNMDINNRDVILVIYGQNVNEEEVTQLTKEISLLCPLIEIIPIKGNQPIYDYILVLQ